MKIWIATVFKTLRWWLWGGVGGRRGGKGRGGREGTSYSKAVIQHGSDITGVQLDLT